MPATPGSHSVEVMTFHGQQYWHGTATTGAELRAILRQVESLGPLGSSSETTLMSAVQEGARRAAEKQPENGARQLLLFTDAGEEGVVFSVDETIAFARTQGVPVHPVILKDNVKQKQLDRTKKLADESGGRLQHGGTDAEFRAAMAAYANAGERLFWLQLSFCGVHPPPGLIHFDDNVSVEVLEAGVRKAITVEAPFRQHAADGALADCATAPIPPPTDPTTTAVPDDDGGLGSLWPWMLGLGGAGLFGLLLLLLFLLLRRRKKDPSAAPQAKAKTLVEIPPAPPVTASGDAAAAAAVGASPGGDAPGLKKGWVNPLKQAPLPDTRLHVVRGPTSLPQYLFVNRKEFSVGASAGEVDQVIDLPKLSGKHATFLLYPLGDIYVTDHSTNGTFVDGQRIPKGTRVKLNPGQRIRLANEVELRLDQPGSG
ncbi:MAG: FHA domain-containing protein, partial [Myxococcota bacterium]|nr:FHA domain-containing protein [Myxococcota bacterium]